MAGCLRTDRDDAEERYVGSVTRRVPRWAGAVLCGATALLGSTTAAEGTAYAAPDDREQCAAAAEQSQQLRDEGKYRRAREQMLLCVRDACPGPIKTDCGKWLAEVERDAPTVVFGARDASGADLLDVKVLIDGVAVQSRLDGKPLLVDAGEHTFTFVTKDGVSKDERVLLRAAEKARAISVTFGAPAVVAPAPAKEDKTNTRVDGESAQGDATRTKDGSLVPALVVGGIGVLALSSFAFFGLSGKSDVDDLQKCKPTCDKDPVDSARTKLTVADISLGVGIVAAAVTTYLLVTRTSGTPDTTPDKTRGSAPPRATRTAGGFSFDAGPVLGGGYASVVGRF